MAQIRHIALTTDDPWGTADFYRRTLGFEELARYGFDPAHPAETPRPSAVIMTDRHINIVIVKPDEDQIGVGLNHVGFHHFGVVVDDMDVWAKRLGELGVPQLTTEADVPVNAHLEIKFRGPDGVVFDISSTCWRGSAPVPEDSTRLPALPEAEGQPLG